MLFKLLAPVALLAASASAQTEDIFSVQTDTTKFALPPATTEGIMSILPIFTNSESGFMSIPQGETPLSTGLSSSGATTPTPTSSGGGPPSGSPSGSASGSAPADTGAAAHRHITAGGSDYFLVMAMSGLSMTIGFAWMLL